jgi:hypothetical protein
MERIELTLCDLRGRRFIRLSYIGKCPMEESNPRMATL